MSILDKLLGRPLAVSEEEGQKIGVTAGIPILGLDALSSAAYGPEAALTILLPAGAAGLVYIGPITIVILVLLFILFLSYRQTIAAYPQGGGSYTVAKENLGVGAGLLAAASLMLDYILNVAVGISAGMGALVSAVPELHPHILALCLATLVLITVINLRGMRESGTAFALPTYLFTSTLGAVILMGLGKAIWSGGHPLPLEAPPPLGTATSAVTLWLLVRAFASGCTAMTGVEAVSNGVTAFREPRVRKAQETLTVIIVILAAMLGGIAYLAVAYHIGATDPDAAGYQTILSQLTAAVVGRSTFYYATMGSVLVVLALSANTSFAGFPRLCSLIAQDDYLPRAFTLLGRRLVYSTGIVILSLIAGFLLVIFGGITDRLIPLFAVGAFGAFTLSQAGMVVHWRRQGRVIPLTINLVGAVSTGVALVVVLVAKFVEGAWITLLVIPALIMLFRAIRRHYESVTRETEYAKTVDLTNLKPPLVILPIRGWTTMAERGLRFALQVSPDIIAVYVNMNQQDPHAQHLRDNWNEYVAEPCQRAGMTDPQLVVIDSPFRELVGPLFEYLRQLKQDSADRTIAVIIPELVELRWYHYFLHNQRAFLLKAALLFFGDDQIMVINVPWYLKD